MCQYGSKTNAANTPTVRILQNYRSRYSGSYSEKHETKDGGGGGGVTNEYFQLDFLYRDSQL